MRSRLLMSLSAVLVLALSGCGSGSGSTTAGRTAAHTTSGQEGLKVIATPKFGPATGPVRSGTVEIAYQNISIRPDTLRVKAGTTVRWTNRDSVEHNVTTHDGPQRFASHNFGEGQSFSVKLTKPGTIHYLCTNHPATMNGTIEVLK